MNLHESLSSSSFMLNEQIARQVFEVLPEKEHQERRMVHPSGLDQVVKPASSLSPSSAVALQTTVLDIYEYDLIGLIVPTNNPPIESAGSLLGHVYHPVRRNFGSAILRKHSL